MNLNRNHLLVAISVLGLLLLAIYYISIHHRQPSQLAIPGTMTGASTLEISEKENCRELQIYVDGAVASVGVYRLQEGDRVHQALAMARPLPNADLRYVGMARELVDGESILVPEYQSSDGEVAQAEQLSLAINPKININRATAAELDAGLEGIGPGLAQRIVDYRTANGPFKKIEDIKKVGGIGEKRFEAIKGSISVY